MNSKRISVLGVLMMVLSLSPMAFADTPVALDAPHGHGVNVSGKVNLFRVQQKGLEIGPKSDFLDAEVLVTLDTQPGSVFGIRLHDMDPAAHEMVETLRQAYLEGRPVIIQHRRDEGRRNLPIIWVQLGELP